MPPFLFIFILVFHSCIGKDSYLIDLNLLVQKNLEYFQLAFPPNVEFDGKLLFRKIESPGATFNVVNLSKIEPFGCRDFENFINLSSMVNRISGTLSTERMTLRVGTLDARGYFGPLSPLNDIRIDLTSPQFNVFMIMSPTLNSRCSLNLTVDLSVEHAELRSDVPFADRRNITDFLYRTVVEYFNRNMSTMTLALSQGECNTYSTFLTVLQSVKTLRHKSLDDIISAQRDPDNHIWFRKDINNDTSTTTHQFSHNWFRKDIKNDSSV